MMVHILFHPQMPPYEDMQRSVKTLEGWKQAAKAWNKVEYTYYDKTAEEVAWIKKVGRLLTRNMPQEFRQGVHLIEKGVCFMGEDLYVCDGHVVPSLQCRHKECGTYNVVSWKSFYCAHCGKKIDRKDTVWGS